MVERTKGSDFGHLSFKLCAGIPFAILALRKIESEMFSRLNGVSLFPDISTPKRKNSPTFLNRMVRHRHLLLFPPLASYLSNSHRGGGQGPSSYAVEDERAVRRRDARGENRVGGSRKRFR
jgi:hypothetical protein